MSPTSRRVRQQNVDTNFDGANTDSEVGRKKGKTRDFVCIPNQLCCVNDLSNYY